MRHLRPRQHSVRPALRSTLRALPAPAGLGMSFDMVSIDAPGATGSYNSALHSKAATVCSALTSGDYDFGFVHVKAVDDTGHDRMMTWRVSEPHAMP